MCTRCCDVRARRKGSFVAIDQLCPHCQYFRKWQSQPVVGSTPLGNLQLSAAIYFTGASFFKLQKVFGKEILKFTNIINGLIATMFCIWLVGVQRNACQDDYTQNFSKAFQHVSGTCNNLYVEERARRSVAAAKPGGQSDSGW